MVERVDCVLVGPPPVRRVEQWDRADFPNISLGYVAAAIRREGAATVHVVDGKLEPLTREQALRRVVDLRPRVVGFSAFTHEIEEAAWIAAQAKEALPGVTTVVGGVHASALPGRTLREFPSFDLLLQGEGERSMPALVRAVVDGGDVSMVAGAWWREGDAVRQGPAPERMADLDGLAEPAWDLFPPAREYPLLSARGCPFACMFCMNNHGRQLRNREPGLVADEMERVVVDHAPATMSIYDETFGLNRETAAGFLQEVRRRGLHRKVRWYATTRISVATPDLLEEMKASGCHMVGFGIESGSPAVMRRIGKEIDLERARSLVRHCRRLGITTQTFFILGHPHETVEEAEATVRCSVELNGDIPCFGIMVPYPNTRIYDMALRGEGGYRLIARGWGDFNKQIGSALELDTMDRKTLERLQLRGYLSTYVKNGRWGDLLRFCWQQRRGGVAVLARMFRRVARPVEDDGTRWTPGSLEEQGHG